MDDQADLKAQILRTYFLELPLLGLQLGLHLEYFNRKSNEESNEDYNSAETPRRYTPDCSDDEIDDPSPSRAPIAVSRMSHYRDNDNLTSQIQTMFLKLRQTDQNWREKKEVVYQLTQMFTRDLECRVSFQIYGSAVDGLGLRDSDLDLLLYLPTSHKKEDNIATLLYV